MINLRCCSFLVDCVMFEVLLFDSVDFSAVFCGPWSGAFEILFLDLYS